MAKKPSSPKKTKKSISTRKPRNAATASGSVPCAGASAPVLSQGTAPARPVHEAATADGSVPRAGASAAVASAPVLSQGTASARPVRSNRGIGGQLAQLEKASAIVGEGLLNKVTGQKRDRNALIDDVPQNLSENDLAPPISTKRARINKAVKPVPQGTFRAPGHGERPLQAAPKPALTFTAKGSPYGFPKVSGSHAPERSNHSALLSITNVQVNTLSNSNDSNSEDDIYKSNNNSDNDANDNGDGNNSDAGHDGASHHGTDDDDNNDNGGQNDNENPNADDGDELRDDEDMGRFQDDEDMGHSQDPDIDEVSPSEDERAAEAFLRAYAPPPRVRGNKVPTEEGAPRNVLAQHHEKNRSNKPPELARLATAALHHATLGQDDELDQENDDEDQDQTQAACHDENQDHSRAARHSKSTGEVKPDTMAYYKGSPWWFILMQAKIKYRRHIALNHGFPDRDEHLSDARDILLEVIEEFKAENETLDQNYHPVREMECLIFKEGATFRGRLKTVAHLEVEKAFRDELHPPDGFESQRELKNVVERNVAKLLSGGNFLMNGKDDMGRTNNLAHPCLRDICINFFYTGKNALARVFPEDFRKSIPDRAIALVATAMRHCLQRYASGMYIDCKFEGIIQSSVYTRMIVLITEIGSNPYHKAKHDSNRRHWAKLGMEHLRPQTEVENHNLEVILD